MIFKYKDNDNNGVEFSLRNSNKTKILINNINSRYVNKSDNEIEIIDFFIERNRVEDVYRYSLVKNNNRYDLMKQTTYSASFELSKFDDIETHIATDNICLLVIESPHKDEYTKDGKFIAKGPAQGTTGDNIEHYLAKLFNTYIKSNLTEPKPDSINIIICNPVQFQSSLYEIHKEPLSENPALRNNCWKSLFDDFGEKEKFKTRFGNYEPLIVINACTSELKDDVTSVIQDFRDSNSFDWLNSMLLFNADKHPCVWSVNTNFVEIQLTNEE